MFHKVSVFGIKSGKIPALPSLHPQGSKGSFMRKKYIMAPGPTPIPAEVLAEASMPIIHHRTPQFQAIFKAAHEGLQIAFPDQTACHDIRFGWNRGNGVSSR